VRLIIVGEGEQEGGRWKGLRKGGGEGKWGGGRGWRGTWKGEDTGEGGLGWERMG